MHPASPACPKCRITSLHTDSPRMPVCLTAARLSSPSSTRRRSRPSTSRSSPTRSRACSRKCGARQRGRIAVRTSALFVQSLTCVRPHQIIVSPRRFAWRPLHVVCVKNSTFVAHSPSRTSLRERTENAPRTHHSAQCNIDVTSSPSWRRAWRPHQRGTTRRAAARAIPSRRACAGRPPCAAPSWRRPRPPRGAPPASCTPCRPS